MLAKLLSLLSTAKGAAAATVIATAGVTGGVAATNEDVQHAITTTVQNVTQQTSANPSASPKGAANASPSGQPAVVAARNAADKKLRDAFQDDQRTLEKLRSTKVEGAEHGKLGDIVKEADAKLRARLTKALDEVAALTLGRAGREASGSPKPSASAAPSASATPSGSPDVAVTFTADTQAKVDAIVTAAVTDMAAIVTDAQKATAALPTFTPGKPSDVPGEKPSGKPSALPGTKPSDAPGGRPSDAPGGAPGARPTAPATPTR